MNLPTTLTKENFWNGMMGQYPLATKMFCDWIDEYKKAVNWDFLFNGGVEKAHYSEIQCHWSSAGKTASPKFHDLPYDMQVGIWIRFAEYSLNHLFEQPEYMYCGDLEDDVKIVFKEINEILIVYPESGH